ncbi:MAG: hypothetical protein NT024_15835 [Proteobacteria bacterium]|jgi:hypothetical protein|nr:hypothetical protein [Pseudomonadota bacterium]
MSKTDQAVRFARRARRLMVALLAAVAGSYWVGRMLGLAHEELIGYLIASVVLVAASGVVGLLVFGVLQLFRRGR